MSKLKVAARVVAAVAKDKEIEHIVWIVGEEMEGTFALIVDVARGDLYEGRQLWYVHGEDLHGRQISKEIWTLA